MTQLFGTFEAHKREQGVALDRRPPERNATARKCGTHRDASHVTKPCCESVVTSGMSACRHVGKPILRHGAVHTIETGVLLVASYWWHSIGSVGHALYPLYGRAPYIDLFECERG